MESSIRDEEEKYELWRMENLRRMFNYIPFIYNLLTTLSESGKLAHTSCGGIHTVGSYEMGRVSSSLTHLNRNIRPYTGFMAAKLSCTEW